MSRDPNPGPTQPGTPWPDPDPHPNGPTGPRAYPVLTISGDR